jgi:hypothetical protein
VRIDIEQLLMNPPRGSALEAARDFGVDLSLLAERLRRTPEERLRDLQRVMVALEKMRDQARLADDRSRTDTTTADK